jgi:hypothetical protein
VDTFVIEPDDQPIVIITVEPAPEFIFQDVGVQGPPGPAPEAGDGIRVVGEVVHVDINRLTFAP